MVDMPLCSWNIQKQLVYYPVENNAFLQRMVNDLVLNTHVQAWTGSLFLDNRHMKVARFSALRTGLLYPPGNTPGTHLC